MMPIYGVKLLYNFLLQILYMGSLSTKRLSKFRNIIFDLIKQDVFVFSGNCKNSGNCCRNIMLYNQEMPINNKKDWDHFLSKFPEYYSFKPTMKGSEITSFNCQSLTKSNRCDRYQKRPTLCKQYPYSFFYQYGFIYETCGYSVHINKKKNRLMFPVIKRHINQFEKKVDK